MNRFRARARLCERLVLTSASVVEIVAPVGYGKTSLARTYAARLGSTLLVDLSLHRDVESIAALLSRELGGPPALSSAEIGAQFERAALASIIFENVHAIARLPEVVAFVATLARAAHGRTVIFCSDATLPAALSPTAFAVPHAIATLRIGDCAFQPEEIVGIFEAFELEAIDRVRIVDATRGWPVAVLLFARLAREQRLRAVLDGRDDGALAEMDAYVHDRLVIQLDPVTLEAARACAAIPHPTLRDIDVATAREGAGSALVASPIVEPFIAIAGNGGLSLHPLVARAIVHHERSAALVVQAAETYERCGEPLRAAELFLAAGDRERAAQALERIDIASSFTPSSRLAEALRNVGIEYTLPRPQLRMGLLRYNRSAEESRRLYDESERVYARQFAIDIESRPILEVTRGAFARYVGRLDEARQRLLAGLAECGGASATFVAVDAPLAHAHLAIVLARLGRFTEARAQFAAIAGDRRYRSEQAHVDLLAARAAGNWESERQAIDAHIAAQRPGLDPRSLAFALRTGASGAWFAGDTRALETMLTSIEEVCDVHDLPEIVRFCEILRGRATDFPDLEQSPRKIAFLRLVLTFAATSRDRARIAISAACEAADLSEEPYLVAVTALVRAALYPRESNAWYARARTAARAIDEPAFAAAVEAWIAGRPAGTALAALAERVERQSWEAGSDVIAIDVLSGVVRRGHQAIAVPTRSLELLVALSLGGTISNEALADRLWPDLDGAAAHNALKTCVHRTRTLLHDRDAIVLHRDGYALGGNVLVDVIEIEATMAEVEASKNGVDDVLSDIQRLHLTEINAAFVALPTVYARWEWFASSDARVTELMRDVGSVLAEDALVRGDVRDVFSVVRTLRSRDPLDESAQELAIRAHVRRGDRTAAAREFRKYRDALEREYAAAPSERLRALVSE